MKGLFELKVSTVQTGLPSNEYYVNINKDTAIRYQIENGIQAMVLDGLLTQRRIEKAIDRLFEGAYE